MKKFIKTIYLLIALSISLFLYWFCFKFDDEISKNILLSIITGISFSALCEFIPGIFDLIFLRKKRNDFSLMVNDLLINTEYEIHNYKQEFQKKYDIIASCMVGCPFMWFKYKKKWFNIEIFAENLKNLKNYIDKIYISELENDRFQECIVDYIKNWEIGYKKEPFFFRIAVFFRKIFYRRKNEKN